MREPLDRAMDRDERKRLGAWYTPHALVDEIVRRAVPHEGRGVLTVVDPACGDGRFLAAAARCAESAGRRVRLIGVDVDPQAVERSRRDLARWDTTIVHADALALDWSAVTEGAVDVVVVGNPPFLSQLSASTARGGASAWGGGPYADVAVEFLALAARVVRGGGSIGLVLPQSVLASRDAASVRRAVARAGALRWLWWSRTPVFDAQVRVCAVVVAIEPPSASAAAPRPAVELSEGLHFAAGRSGAAIMPDDADWGRLLASGLGVPAIPDELATDGSVGDRAAAHLDFRDEYYGLVPAVVDGGVGAPLGNCAGVVAPLVTSGLIEPGRCDWGSRPARFARSRFAAPVVVLDRLTPAMRRWAESRLVPKVLVASQTRVIEAAVDSTGSWLPSVPTVTLVPIEHAGVSGGAASGQADDRLWDIAAVLTSAVASAWLAARSAGTALSTHALRVTPAALAAMPWPAGDVSGARAALRAGDVIGCGQEVAVAYGLTPPCVAALDEWWRQSLTRRSPDAR